MIAMLITLPAKGFVALRNALGEAPAIAISQALDEAQVRGEAELAAKILADAEARLQRASAETAARLQNSRKNPTPGSRRTVKNQMPGLRRAVKNQTPGSRKAVKNQTPNWKGPARNSSRCTASCASRSPNCPTARNSSASPPTPTWRTTLPRAAPDKKMTMGFLALSALQLAPNAPLFLEWGAKVVGYALK